MSEFIKIVSSQKIEVQRELAFVDRSPDLTKQGSFVAVGGGDLVRVNTLKPITYQFQKGVNNIPDPLPTFIDPITRKEVSESILTWAGVKHLIDAGVFEAFKPDQKLNVEESTKTEKTKKKPSLDDISETSK